MRFVEGIDHATFAVRDLERALRFYAGVPGVGVAARWDGGAYLTTRLEADRRNPPPGMRFYR